MSARPAGRRIATPASTRGLAPRRALLPLALVAATAAALVLAGTAPDLRPAAPPASRTATVAQEFTCSGGLPNARLRAGGVGSGAVAVGGDRGAVTSAPLRAEPVVVRAPASVADRAYAVRWASGRGWYAAGRCPAPRAEWWFLGAGAGGTHRGVLRLDNPREGDAVVDVRVLGPNGPVETPGMRGLRVASGESVRFDLREVAAAFGDLAVHVVATRGLVAASLPERWSSELASRMVRDWVTAQPPAGRRATLVGLARPAAAASLLVANPSASEAVVDLRLVGEQGDFAPTGETSLRVPPGTTRSLRLADIRRTRPFAVQVRSTVRVATSVRTVVGTDEAHAAAVRPIRDAAVVGVPAVAWASLDLVAGRKDAEVTVIGYDEAGRTHRRALRIHPGAALSVRVRPNTVAVEVRADSGSVRGALVLRPRGAAVATVPLLRTGTGTRVPAVRPGR